MKTLNTLIIGFLISAQFWIPVCQAQTSPFKRSSGGGSVRKTTSAPTGESQYTLQDLLIMAGESIQKKAPSAIQFATGIFTSPDVKSIFLVDDEVNWADKEIAHQVRSGNVPSIELRYYLPAIKNRGQLYFEVVRHDPECNANPGLAKCVAYQSAGARELSVTLSGGVVYKGRGLNYDDYTSTSTSVLMSYDKIWGDTIWLRQLGAGAMTAGTAIAFFTFLYSVHKVIDRSTAKKIVREMEKDSSLKSMLAREFAEDFSKKEANKAWDIAKALESKNGSKLKNQYLHEAMEYINTHQNAPWVREMITRFKKTTSLGFRNLTDLHMNLSKFMIAFLLEYSHVIEFYNNRNKTLDRIKSGEYLQRTLLSKVLASAERFALKDISMDQALLTPGVQWNQWMETGDTGDVSSSKEEEFTEEQKEKYQGLPTNVIPCVTMNLDEAWVAFQKLNQSQASGGYFEAGGIDTDL